MVCRKCIHYKLHKQTQSTSKMHKRLYPYPCGIQKRNYFFLSNWRIFHCLELKNPVIRSVPQGLLLAPIVSDIFVNDLEDGTQCTFSKFADDVEPGGVLHTSDGCATNQRNLKRLEKGGGEEHAKVSKGKSKALHLRKNKPVQFGG